MPNQCSQIFRTQGIYGLKPLHRVPRVVLSPIAPDPLKLGTRRGAPERPLHARGATVSYRSYRSYLDVTGQHVAREDGSLRCRYLKDGVDGIDYAGRESPAHGERQ